MKKIKFSHSYYKLQDCFSEMGEKNTVLLQALKINYRDLSALMKDYDTKYKKVTFRHGIHHYFEDDFYPLPESDLILLIFMSTGLFDRVFTTLRRFTPEKWKYYKNSEGETFEVVVKEGG